MMPLIYSHCGYVKLENKVPKGHPGFLFFSTKQMSKIQWLYLLLLNHMVQKDRLGMTANVSELLAWFLA